MALKRMVVMYNNGLIYPFVEQNKYGEVCTRDARRLHAQTTLYHCGLQPPGQLVLSATVC